MIVKFKRRTAGSKGWQPIDIMPLINCIFLVFLFFLFVVQFTPLSGIYVTLPKTFTTQTITAPLAVVHILHGDIIEVDGKKITLEEMRLLFQQKKYSSVFIKAEPGVSLGVLVKIWGVCKDSGIEKIGIASRNFSPR